MSLSSWFRRRLLRQIDQFTESSIPLRKSDGEKEEQFHGVTDGLIEFVKSFTIETFKNFPLQDEGEALCGDQNLSDWQERHAVLVLSKVKEISQLRYKLCPGHLKEHQFWKIYFALVKSLVVDHELKQRNYKADFGGDAKNADGLCSKFEFKAGQSDPSPLPSQLSSTLDQYFNSGVSSRRQVRSSHPMSRYELRAIQLDKLRRMALGNEGSSNCTSSYEVEMAETNTASHLAPVGPLTP
ncbi:hypothetical protein SDJN02_03062 [Cucurbita argyrosperma subsp. argyrosperma]|nr:hypothetical protein SDJN02_03062 [Cucurbita argyrosperma subsp. argyrosperma]